MNTLKRKADDSDADKLAKKSFTQPSIAAVVNFGHVTQSKVDDLILDFMVSDMQPFSIVEQPSFIRLITGLQPGKVVMSRKTLVG